MFDMGFTEMMLIGIVALIVIGPERLPAVARTAGKYFGRLKRFMTSVRAEVEQELRADELRQILADQQKELDTIKDSMNVVGKKFENEINAVSDAGESIAKGLDETPSDPEQGTKPGDNEPGSTPEPQSAPEPRSIPEPEPVSKNSVGESKS